MRKFTTRAPRGGRVTLLAALAAAALSISLVGCASSGSSPGDGTASGGNASGQVLTIGFSAEPPGFKTGVDQGSANKQVLTLVRRGLLSYGPDGTPVPALASDYKVSDDGLTYTFTLRPGLKFSNGDPLTAADVKRTFEYLAVSDNGAADVTSFENVAKIDTPSDTSVILTLKEPQTAFPQVLASPLNAIVPKEPVDSQGVPVGSGPFMITAYSKGVSYTLKKNPTYYDADAVKLSGIDMTFMPDAQTRVKALIGGQVQFIDYVAASDYKTLQASSGVVLKTVPSLFGAVQFNLTHEPLNKPEVRQAIAYAIDLNAYNQAGTLGFGTPSGGLPIPVDSQYWDKTQAHHFDRDVDKAKSLLAAAGYPNGFTVKLLTNSQYFGYTERAQVVKANLADIGVTADIVTGDYANQIALGNAGTYDLMIGGPPAAIRDPSAINGAFLGGPSFVRSFGIDQSLYADLLKKGASTPDGAARQAIYQQIGEVYLKDVPFVTTGMGTAGYAYTDKLDGFSVLSGPIVYSSLYSLATASLKS